MDLEDEKIRDIKHQTKKAFMKFLMGYQKISINEAKILIFPKTIGPLIKKFSSKDFLPNPVSINKDKDLKTASTDQKESSGEAKEVDVPNIANEGHDDVPNKSNGGIDEVTNEINEEFDKVPEKSNEGFDDAPNEINEEFDKVPEKNNEEFDGAPNEINEEFDNIPEKSNEGFDDAPNEINEEFDKVPEKTNEGFDDAPNEINEEFDNIPEKSNEGFDDAPNEINEEFDKVPEKTNEGFDDAPNEINEEFDNIPEKSNEGFDDAPNEINEEFDEVPEKSNEGFDDAPNKANKWFEYAPNEIEDEFGNASEESNGVPQIEAVSSTTSVSSTLKIDATSYVPGSLALNAITEEYLDPNDMGNQDINFTSQEEYYPPQQSFYAPQQGFYGPQQGFYGPQQGVYGPQQGFFVPQQSYYLPQQPYSAPPQDYNTYGDYQFGNIPIPPEEYYYLQSEPWYQYEYYETWPIKDYIIELSRFPRYFRTCDLLNIYTEKPRYIKWCDDYHALLVTSSTEHAYRALHVYHPLVKSKPMSIASPIAIMTSRRFLLKPATQQNRGQSRRDENMFPRNKLASQQGSGVISNNDSNDSQVYSSQDAEPVIHASASQALTNFKAKHYQYITTERENGEVLSCPFNKVISDTDMTVLRDWETILNENKKLVEKCYRIYKEEVAIILASEDYGQFETEVFEKMDHIIELYDIPAVFDEKSLLNIYTEEPHTIIFFEATSAVLVMGSVEQAERALQITTTEIKSRSMLEASLTAVAFSLELCLTPVLCNMSNKKQKDDNNIYDSPCSIEEIEAEDDNNISDTPRRVEEIVTENDNSIKYMFNNTKKQFGEGVPVVNPNIVFTDSSTLTAMVKKNFNNPTFIVAREDYRKYEPEILKKMEYIIELYNIPASYTERDLMSIYKEQPCYIKRYDDNNALLVTGSSEQAKRALLVNDSVVKSRSMMMASLKAISVACRFKLAAPTDSNDSEVPRNIKI